MADEVRKESCTEIPELLSEFLLSAEVSNVYTLDDFKELFPLNFRDHEDVKQLYKAFQSKRKNLRAIVKRNIKRHCQAASVSQQLGHDQKQSQVIRSNIDSSEDEQQHLKEKLTSVRNDVKAAERQFFRCAKQLSEVDIFQGLSDKDFHVETLQLLGKKLENVYSTQ